MKTLFLTGLSGSGKTTLGKQAAKALNLKFFDLDKMIRQELGMRIPEIFKVHGEKHFREMERSLLNRICSGETNFLMATGGGTPCFYENLKMMKKYGIVIFLDVPVKVLVTRLLKKKEHQQDRPLLSGTPERLEEALHRMRNQRISHYYRASLVIKGSSITISDLLSNLRY